MQQYTNRFQYAINSDQTEFCLNFLQQSPEIPLDNSLPLGAATETVAQLVMSYSTALELLSMLKEALEEA